MRRFSLEPKPKTKYKPRGVVVAEAIQRIEAQERAQVFSPSYWQGVATDLINRDIQRSGPVFQVHDELIYEVQQ